MMSAVLSNPSHPEYGVATIPFPISRDQYTYCMELMEQVGGLLPPNVPRQRDAPEQSGMTMK